MKVNFVFKITALFFLVTLTYSCKRDGKVGARIFNTKVEGKVIDANNGAVVPGAWVVLYWTPKYSPSHVPEYPFDSVQTDANGAFDLKFKLHDLYKNIMQPKFPEFFEDEFYFFVRAKKEPDFYQDNITATTLQLGKKNRMNLKLFGSSLFKLHFKNLGDTIDVVSSGIANRYVAYFLESQLIYNSKDYVRTYRLYSNEDLTLWLDMFPDSNMSNVYYESKVIFKNDYQKTNEYEINY